MPADRSAIPDAPVEPAAASAPERRSRLRDPIPWLLTPVAAAVTLPRLGLRPFWFDEVRSMVSVEGPFADLIPRLDGSGGNMSLYFALLEGWTRLGTSETVVRLLSVLFAVASVPLLYLLGRRLFDRRVAALAAVLLFSGALYLVYAQEARSYSMVLFLSIASTLLLVRALDRASPLRWLAYAAVAGAGVFAHFLFPVVIAAHILTVALRPGRKGLPALGLALALVPAIPVAVHAARAADRFEWVPELSGSHAWGQIQAVAGGRVQALVLGAAVAAGAFLLAATSRRADGTREGFGVVLPLLVVPPAGLALVSIVEPVFLARYLTLWLPGIALAAAFGIARLRPPPIRAIAALAVVGASLAGVVAEHGRVGRNEDWPSAAAQVAAGSRAGDVVIVRPAWAWEALDWHARHDGIRLPTWGRVDASDATGPDKAVEAPPGERIWLVASRYLRRGATASTLERLDGGYRRAERWDFQAMTVLLFEPRPSAAPSR